MSGIQIAETKSSKKKSPQTVDHLEIHPKMGGGHIVKHVYSGYDHEPKEVHFNEDGKAKGGEHIVAHLEKHAGLPAMAGGEGNGESPSEEDEY